MKVTDILRKAVSISGSILSFLPKWRKRRLYQEWVDRSELPPDAVPREEFVGEIAPGIGRGEFRRNLMFILLGAVLVLLIEGIVLLVFYW